ncbi:hypothetical protein [Actinoplanes sp. NPDC049265]
MTGWWLGRGADPERFRRHIAERLDVEIVYLGADSRSCHQALHW